MGDVVRETDSRFAKASAKAVALRIRKVANTLYPKKSIGGINAVFPKAIECRWLVRQSSTHCSPRFGPDSCRRRREIATRRRDLPANSSRQAERCLPFPPGYSRWSWSRGDLVIGRTKPTCGGARLSGNSRGLVLKLPVWSRCMRIVSISAGSSMQAMILTAPPHA